MGKKNSLDMLEKELAATTDKQRELEAKLSELQAHKKTIQAEWDAERRREATLRANAFKARLEKENGVVGHPKADLLFSKAWDLGHAYGESEVEHYYEDLVDLIK